MKELGVKRPDRIIGKDGRSTPAVIGRRDTEAITRRREKVKELLSNGATVLQVAEKIGESRYTIYNDIRLNGDHLVDCPHCGGSGKVLKKTIA